MRMVLYCLIAVACCSVCFAVYGVFLWSECVWFLMTESWAAVLLSKKKQTTSKN